MNTAREDYENYKSASQQGHSAAMHYVRNFGKESKTDLLDKIRAEIESYCGLLKENHCKYCSYCNSVMGVREILEIFDKYKSGSSERKIFGIEARLQAIKEIASNVCEVEDYKNIAEFCDEIYDLVKSESEEENED